MSHVLKKGMQDAKYLEDGLMIAGAVRIIFSTAATVHQLQTVSDAAACGVGESLGSRDNSMLWGKIIHLW